MNERAKCVMFDGNRVVNLFISVLFLNGELQIAYQYGGIVDSYGTVLVINLSCATQQVQGNT